MPSRALQTRIMPMKSLEALGLGLQGAQGFVSIILVGNLKPCTDLASNLLVIDKGFKMLNILLAILSYLSQFSVI